MADEKEERDPRVDNILQLAIGAAGPVTDSLARWQNKVMHLIGEITNVFAEGSPQYRYAHNLLHSPSILGTFTGLEFNENSRRYKVLYVADKSRKGDNAAEHIWSERVHTPIGAIQQATLRELSQGERVRIWKTLEKHEDRGPDGMTIRTLVHIARIDAAASSGTGSAPPALPPPERAAASPRPAAPASPEGSVPSGEATTSKIPNPSVATAWQKLPAKRRLALAQWGRDNGIPNMFDPDLTDEQVQSILVHCELIQREMA